MEKYEAIKFILVVILIGCVILIIEFKSKVFKSKLLQDGSLTVGYITKYVRGGPPGVSPGFYYKYTDSDNGKEYHKKESYKLPSYKERKKIKKNDSFLVLYRQKESRLLFEYPIKDNSDFEKYLKEFEEKRKENN